MKRIICIIICLTLLLLTGCTEGTVIVTKGDKWTMGFADCEIDIPKDSEYPLYLAGFKNGKKATGTYDKQRTNAVWLDVNGTGHLIIGIDCIGLSSESCNEIRERLADFCAETNCISVNIYSTHTHAGIDTLGLWGPVATDGKNPDFMENLFTSAVTAAKSAYENSSPGKLYYGAAKTAGILNDNRYPLSFDSNIYQLRFVPENNDTNGIRMLFYGTHAEALGSTNSRVSRDIPGALADTVKAATGDDVMFLPGAIGGQIVTADKTDDEVFVPSKNLKLTAQAIARFVYEITPDTEREISPEIAFSCVDVSVELDNTLFLYYKFLGILDNDVESGGGETGYSIRTTLSVMKLGDITVAMLPGEIFPELITGSNLTVSEDPLPLNRIAQENGVGNLLIIGLCNDEIGYIVTPSDYVVDEQLPYFSAVEEDAFGEDHYEETNSAGKNVAFAIADGFDRALKQLNEN